MQYTVLVLGRATNTPGDTCADEAFDEISDALEQFGQCDGSVMNILDLDLLSVLPIPRPLHVNVSDDLRLAMQCHA